MKLFLFQNSFFTENEYSKAYLLLSGERKKRYNMANRTGTKKQLLFGSLSLEKVCQFCSIEVSRKDIYSKSVHHIIFPEKVYMSLSHKNDMLVIIVSTDDVSVDIEFMQSRSKKVLARMNTTSIIDFYEKWIKKECYLKINNCSPNHKITYCYDIESYIIGMLGNEDHVQIFKFLSKYF